MLEKCRNKNDTKNNPGSQSLALISSHSTEVKTYREAVLVKLLQSFENETDQKRHFFAN